MGKLTALALVCVLCGGPGVALNGRPPAARLKTESVILVTADGLRHQELFGGLDAAIVEDKQKAGVDDVDALRARFWRPTPEERRRF